MSTVARALSRQNCWIRAEAQDIDIDDQCLTKEYEAIGFVNTLRHATNQDDMKITFSALVLLLFSVIGTLPLEAASVQTPAGTTATQKTTDKQTSTGLLAAEAARTTRLNRHLPELLDDDPDHPATQELIIEANALINELSKRASELSMTQAMERALVLNPDLATAYYNIQGSEWSLISIRRSWYPSLQIDGNKNDLKTNEPMILNQNYKQVKNLQTGATGRWDQTFNTGPGIVFNWSFFDPTRQPAINQALQSLFAQRFLFDIAARSLALNLQVAYCNVQAEAELTNRYRWLFTETRKVLNSAERMPTRNRLTQTSLDQLKTEERLQLTNLIDRYQQLLLSANRLSQIVAETPGRIALTSTPLTQEDAWHMGLENTLQQALSMREEIKQKLALAQRDRWSATRTIHGYLPVFGLFGVSTLVNDATTTSDSQTLAAGVGINFRWNVFDGGIRAADATSLKAQAASQISSAASERLTVSKQVMDAYTSYKTAALALRNTATDFSLAKKTVQNAIAKLRTDRDVTTLIQTFSLYKSAADRDTNSRRQYNTGIYSLYRYSALWPETAIKPLEQRKQGLTH